MSRTVVRQLLAALALAAVLVAAVGCGGAPDSGRPSANSSDSGKASPSNRPTPPVERDPG
jgi:hypothetical protein